MFVVYINRQYASEGKKIILVKDQNEIQRITINIIFIETLLVCKLCFDIKLSEFDIPTV